MRKIFPHFGLFSIPVNTLVTACNLTTLSWDEYWVTALRVPSKKWSWTN